MKTIANIYQCECGRNIIVLNENFEDGTNTDDMQCPICGREMVSGMIREIDINKISR